GDLLAVVEVAYLQVDAQTVGRITRYLNVASGSSTNLLDALLEPRLRRRGPRGGRQGRALAVALELDRSRGDIGIARRLGRQLLADEAGRHVGVAQERARRFRPTRHLNDRRPAGPRVAES